jgi:hypothetical protein
MWNFSAFVEEGKENFSELSVLRSACQNNIERRHRDEEKDISRSHSIGAESVSCK